MLPWLPILRSALYEEYDDRPQIATLATVDLDRRPRARTVILRQIDDNGTLWIASDGDSGKNAQLRHNGDAELVLYLPSGREQFRLLGRCIIIGRGDDEPIRQQFWESLTDSTRAMYFWTTIDQPASETQMVPTAVAETTPMPDNFELIALRPEQIEHLTTASIPHRRKRYRQITAWRPESINP